MRCGTCLSWCACKDQRVTIGWHQIGGVWIVFDAVCHGTGDPLVLATAHGRTQVGNVLQQSKLEQPTSMHAAADREKSTFGCKRYRRSASMPGMYAFQYRIDHISDVNNLIGTNMMNGI